MKSTNSSTGLIHHHLGLGDHFICNGLVNYLISYNPKTKFSLACKEHNFPTVSSMYKHCVNLEVCSVRVDSEVENIYHNYDQVYRAGFEGIQDEKHWEEGLYESVGIPFSARWNYCLFPRDYAKEQQLFNNLTNGKDYNNESKRNSLYK